MQHEDAWLSSIMPTGWSAAQSSHSLEPLELHKRLVHLATLREAALQHLGQLDGVKVSLTERKATQQGRLLAALDARLATAHAAVEPHRCAAWDLVKSLEKEAAFYSDVLKGIQQSPPAEQWAALTERYQHLQQQVHQQQEQAVKASDLEQTLSASLQPCQPEHVQLVEQLRSQVDSLTQQLQQANMAQQRQQEAEQQQVHCAHELAAMQQLAALVLQQLQVYHCMQLGEQQQQQQLGLHRVAPSLQPGGHHHHQQQQPQQPQHALGCSGEVTAGREATQVQSVSAGTGSCSSLLARCHRLKQQLQQLSDAADMLVQLAPCSSSKPAAAADSAAAFSNPQLDMLSNELQDPLDRGSFGSSALSPGGLAADQVWQEVQGLTAPHSAPQPMQQQQQLRGMSVRLHPALHQHSSGCGGGCSTMPLHVVKLRLAYQQMLHKVQARYQHDLRQLEVKQQEALQAQSHSQQQAMADMVKQHQEVCGRLAAAATAEADLQQQLARLAGDKQMLQQQIDKLQREVGGAAASAIAVVQVQHEQQLLAAKQEQQQLLQDAKRQVESLQQQLQDLRQQAVQQASALPLAETVAALVADATAKQSAQQQEQLQQLESTYQAALQQREQQHLSLLQDLSELRQLQEEASALSSSSAATDVTAAAIPGTAAASAAPAAAPAAAAAYPSASASATLQPLGAWVSDVAAEGAVPPGVRNCSTSVSEDNGQRRTAPSESGQAVVGGCANADPLAQHRGTGHTTTAAAAAASAVEQQRILQMLDSSLSVSQTGQPPKGESQHAERYQQQQQHGGDYHHQQQHAGSFQHQQQQAGEHHEQQQQQQQQQYADGCNSHQQQQQFEPGGQDEDAMGALIAAVLGPGRIGRAQQQLHKQRMAAAQQQHQQHQQQGSSTVHQRQTEAAQQQQQMRVSPRHQPIQPLDLQEELDKLLGLSGSPSTVPSGRYKSGSNSKAAALASKQGLGLGQQALVGYSNSAALAPANAELAAAMARAKVAETCLPALQDISCSSTCNKAAEGPHQPGLKASRAPPNSSGEVARGSDRPPWKPASPGRVTSPQKQRQQQWQQWQQLPKGSGSSGGGSGCGSPNRGGSRTPSPIRQQRAAGQQQQEGLPVLQCVRCGEQEGPGPDGSGACCFHPGLVPAPGPLMYGPEWHACRARCTPDMPGCYTRQDHFFAPLLDCPNRASQPGPPSSTGATTQSEPPARNAPASSSTAAAAAGGGCSPRTLAARQSARAAEAGGLASPAGIGSPRFTHQQYSTTSSRDRPASSPKRAINSSSSSMSKEKACGVGMSPPWAVATGRYVGAGAAAAGAQQVPSCDDSRAGVFVGFTEPEPRNSLPKPSVWRG